MCFIHRTAEPSSHCCRALRQTSMNTFKDLVTRNEIRPLAERRRRNDLQSLREHGGERQAFCGSEAEIGQTQRISLAEHAQSALVGERDICVRSGSQVRNGLDWAA